MKRRDVLRGAVASVVAGFSRPLAARPQPSAREPSTVARPALGLTNGVAGRQQTAPRADADYIVVGSGAGGGTVAARLVEAGYSVVVLEAGGDPRTLSGSDAAHPGVNGLPHDYDVPAFHAFSTENDAMKWDFYVRHYANAEQQRLDPKYVAEHDGIWYPRAGTLGGCTAHNAMILVYPSNADWDQLADLTGDASWRADNMRTYFERLENCHHRPLDRVWRRLGINPSRHGWSGWLHTEKADPGTAILDSALRRTFAESVHAALQELGMPSPARLEALGDPNDWRVVQGDEIGARYTPLTTRNHQRVGSRERLLEVKERYPARLKIELNALATRVLFDGARAIGVEYQSGERLYSAHARASQADGTTHQVFAAREVVLAGGAFNTPQLLMLSGIGPRDVLDENRIPVRHPLEGVGRRLQDRYEIAVVNRMPKPWEALKGASFSTSDRQFEEWRTRRQGVYTTNGSVACVIARSTAGIPQPDLFCYALIGDFRGYVPGYSKALPEHLDRLTWVVLKGHTNNTGGRVVLRSPNPRATPAINFHYFQEGSTGAEDDLNAVVSGIQLARNMTAGVKRQLGAVEEFPGDAYDTPEKLKTLVRNQAWGHHASCTCAIGPEAAGGVLTSDFKVHGTDRLRVVDASVFPRVPGLFIVSAVYMIGEKAADVMIREARGAES